MISRTDIHDMTDAQDEAAERIAIALWREEAAAGTPSVQKRRNTDTWADQAPELRGRWMRFARAALAAAPQPAPEQGMTRAEAGQMLDTKRHDREVLVEVINAAMDGRELVDGEPWGAEAIADALLAAGWTRGGDAAGLRRDDAG